MERSILPGPSGDLEAELWLPEGSPRAAAAVCHPHPLHGGTMDTTAVYRTARGLQQAGLAVLRFNFRGVGASAGEHHGAGGPGSEEDDLAAALDWLAREHPGLPLWAGGFSFGSRTALGLALRDDRIARLVLVALPVLRYHIPGLRNVPAPGLAVMAGEDEFGTLADLLERYPTAGERLELREIAGADHYFSGRSQELQETVRGWSEREFH